MQSILPTTFQPAVVRPDYPGALFSSWRRSAHRFLRLITDLFCALLAKGSNEGIDSSLAVHPAIAVQPSTGCVHLYIVYIYTPCLH